MVVNARRGDLPNQLQPNSKNYNIKILLQVHEKIRSRRRGSREEEKIKQQRQQFFFSARHTNQINRCRGVLNWHEPAAAKWRGVWYRCLDDVATLRPSSPQRVWQAKKRPPCLLLASLTPSRPALWNLSAGGTSLMLSLYILQVDDTRD